MSKETKFVILVFIVALAIRLGFVFWLGEQKGVFPDSIEYLKIAKNLTDGKGFILDKDNKATRPPAYPIFLAGGKMVFGNFILSSQIRQAIIGAISVLLVYWLAGIAFSHRVGLISALIFTFHPYLVYVCGLIQYETVFTALFLLEMLLLVIAIKENITWLICLAGFVSGIVALFHPLHLFSFLFIIPAFIKVARNSWKIKTITVWIAFVLFNILPIAPWTIRNYIVLNKFVPITVQLGYALADAFAPGATGATDIDKIKPWLEEANAKGLNEVQRDKFLRYKSIDTILQDPARVIILAFKKLGYFFNIIPNAKEYKSNKYIIASLLFISPLFLFALTGIYFARSERYAMLFISPILCYTILHLIFIGSIRYRLPVEPYIIIFAGYGIAKIYNNLFAKDGK